MPGGWNKVIFKVPPNQTSLWLFEKWSDLDSDSVWWEL